MSHILFSESVKEQEFFTLLSKNLSIPCVKYIVTEPYQKGLSVTFTVFCCNTCNKHMIKSCSRPVSQMLGLIEVQLSVSRLCGQSG